MKSTTERTAPDQQAGTAANSTAKLPWHTPEIEEVDFAETQNGAVTPSTDTPFNADNPS